MWRPEDWDEIKLQPQRPGLFEAVADAILEGLKKEGQHTDGLVPMLCINVRPEQKGWLVFIPEE